MKLKIGKIYNHKNMGNIKYICLGYRGDSAILRALGFKKTFKAFSPEKYTKVCLLCERL